MHPPGVPPDERATGGLLVDGWPGSERGCSDQPVLLVPRHPEDPTEAFFAVSDKVMLPAVAALNEARSQILALCPARATTGGAPSQRWSRLQNQLLSEITASSSSSIGSEEASAARAIAVAAAFLVAEAIKLDELAGEVPEDEQYAAVLAHLHTAASGARRTSAELRATGRELRERGLKAVENVGTELVPMRDEVATTFSASENEPLVALKPPLPETRPPAMSTGVSPGADRTALGWGRLVAIALTAAAVTVATASAIWPVLPWNGLTHLLLAVLVAASLAALVLGAALSYRAAVEQDEASTHQLTRPDAGDRFTVGDDAISRSRRKMIAAMRLVGVVSAVCAGACFLVGLQTSTVPMAILGSLIAGGLPLLLAVVLASLAAFARPASEFAGVFGEIFCITDVRRAVAEAEERHQDHARSPRQSRFAPGGRGLKAGFSSSGKRTLVAAAVVLTAFAGGALLGTSTAAHISTDRATAATALAGAAQKANGLRSGPPAVVLDSGLASDTHVLIFSPGQAQFRDTAAAIAILKDVAAVAQDHPSVNVSLVGTTSRVGSPESQVALSSQRAELVRWNLVSLAVPPERITVEGLGGRFPEYIPDRAADGSILPGAAAANDAVRIRLTPGGK